MNSPDLTGAQQGLADLQRRISRISERFQDKRGSGFERTYGNSEGNLQTVRFEGIKSPENYKDELLHLFALIWNLKDHLKELAIENDRDPKEIENLVNRNSELKYVADVANLDKHGRLNSSRSGENPTLADLGVIVVDDAIEKITVGAKNVSIYASKPAMTKYRANLKSQSGRILGNAEAILERALDIWELEGLPLAQKKRS